MKVVVPSKGRSGTIMQRTLKFFPDAIVTLDEEDYDAYSKAGVKNIVVHPYLGSISRIRGWIINHFEDEMLFVSDDDLTRVTCVVGRSPRRLTDPDDIMQIVDNAGYITKGIGAGYFGFIYNPNPQIFTPFSPMKLSSMVGGFSGHVGRSVQYDDKLTMYEDVDFCLTQLLVNRIIYIDTRFIFETLKTLHSPGGNSYIRDNKINNRDHAYLKEKWGRYLTIQKDNAPMVNHSEIRRKQS